MALTTQARLTRFIQKREEKKELKHVLKAIKKKSLRLTENYCGFYELSKNNIRWLKAFGYEVKAADLFDQFAYYVIW